MPAAISLKSPLPAADLLFESMTASAGLSMLGETQLGLVSARPDLKPEALLGKPMTVTVNLADDAKRYFHGYVTRFGIGLRRGPYFGYQASVRPWLWFLTRTADCKIFQDLSVPDIVKKVFDDHANAHFEFKLFRSYRKWVYCVQYRETDFNFIARLLEHEGIYWYIEHGDGQSKVVLVDSQSAHDAAPGCESLPYYESASDAPPDLQCVSHWDWTCEVETDRVELASYDFERPSTRLKANAKKSLPYDLGVLEMFDFQGDYQKSADGAQWAEDRLDEHQTRYQTARGAANARALEVGRIVGLTRHPREDQNAQYMVTGLSVHASVEVDQSGGSAGGFHCDFSAIPSSQQFRPPRRTPKPFVQGPQTAIVVGPGGEEIYTDKYGRVKVQFHWDRLGQKDDKSSCWVRVSHPWAGKNFGAVHIPRIGQEVVIGFLEGDPDQPLITGRVYNAEQMPPWDLPANATQSGVLTRSSKGGSAANANAIRFEDKKGAEQLWIHAEKDQSIEVEHDEAHWVGNDRKKTVDHDETTQVKHDRTETVGNNETITIGVNRVERVGSNETITIGSNRTESVGSDETISIGANRSEKVGVDETIKIGSNRTISVGASETATVALQRTHSVGINETIAIGAAQEIAIGAAQVVAVGAMQTITVGLNQSTSVGAAQSNTVGAAQSNKIGAAQSTDVAADRSLRVGGAQATTVGKGRSTSVAEDDTLKVGKNLIIEASESILLKTGDASITMKKDGTITLKGKDLAIDASGKVAIKAGGDIGMNAAKIKQN